MVKDLELMKDITPLFIKKIIVWGIGKNGRSIIKELKAMGAGKEGIFLCDSNCELWGETVMEHKIISPDQLREAVEKDNSDEIAVIVTVLSIQLQDEIIERIHEIFGTSVDIYTEYGFTWGTFYDIKNAFTDSSYKNKKLMKSYLFISLGKWLQRRFTKVYKIMVIMFCIVTNLIKLEAVMTTCTGC